tara:strand:- start:5828 stop:6931 length:1104 start_codon:yes stop_codon:yes gene_type:complete
MANTFITPSVVAREALMILENNLVAANLFDKSHVTDFTGAKVGDTITIRGPASFTAQEFTSTTTTQNITETSVSLQLEKHFDVTVGVTSKEWTLNLDQFSQRVIQPAVAAIAQKIDSYILTKASQQLYNNVGTAGDPPDSLADVAAIDKKLNDLKCPVADRIAIVNSTGKSDILSNITEFTRANERGDGGNALRTASMGEFMGMQWYMDQNIASIDTAGPASYLVNSASVAVGDSSVAIDGGSNTPVVGDLFTVAGDTQQYIVTGWSSPTLSFSPTAKVAWADNAALTFNTTDHVANLAGDRRGLSLAIVPLELPAGSSDAEYISDRDLGIRVVYDYAASTKTDTISFDVLCGAVVQQPDLLTQVLG